MPVIYLETVIHADKRIVFDLSRSIDLHKISTKQTNETAINGRVTGLIEQGESVTWRAKHFGISQTLTSKVTEFKSPTYFADEMVKGAFKSFKHEHHFKENSPGTLMVDIFSYQMPFGIVGTMVNQLFLKQYMKNFLTERNQVIKAYAETGKWKEILPEN